MKYGTGEEYPDKLNKLVALLHSEGINYSEKEMQYILPKIQQELFEQILNLGY